MESFNIVSELLDKTVKYDKNDDDDDDDDDDEGGGEEEIVVRYKAWKGRYKILFVDNMIIYLDK